VARRTAIRGPIRAGARRARRGAARTAHRSRVRPGAFATPGGAAASLRAARFASFRPVTGFYIAGGILAAWALLVSFLGIVREDFPATRGAARLVAAISIVLVIAAVGTGIYLSATEEHEPEEEHAAAR
jgi:hypothetical protein